MGDQSPAFQLAERASFHDPDCIPDARLAFLVMRHEGRRPADMFFIDRVRDAAFDRDDDALLHLVADHFPDAGLPAR
jgi:hypothetical protein